MQLKQETKASFLENIAQQPNASSQSEIDTNHLDLPNLIRYPLPLAVVGIARLVD
jgi:hypothetical protein